MNDQSDKQDLPGRNPAPQGEQRADRFVGRLDLTRWRTASGRRLARATRWVSGRLGPHSALIMTLVIGALIAIALTAVSTEVYEAVTEGDGVAALDHPLLNAVITVRSPALNAAITAYTNVGGPIGMPILALLAIIILAVKRRSWTPVILVTAAAAGSLLMTVVGKQLIARARPPLADAVPPFEYSASFPSGHALNALVIAGVVAYLIVLRQRSKRARVFTIAAAATFAFTMGLSRVYLGHHWFTDVLVAWLLGAAWLVLVITAHRLYLTTRTQAGGVTQRAKPA